MENETEEYVDSIQRVLNKMPKINVEEKLRQMLE